MHSVSTIFVISTDSLESLKFQVEMILNYDSDWNGDNVNLIDEAEAGGYSSNNAYLVDTHLIGTSVEDIENFFNKYFQINRSYDYVLDFLDLSEFMNKECFTVALSVTEIES